MRSTRLPALRLLVGLLALVLVAAACGSDDDPDPVAGPPAATTTTAPDPRLPVLFNGQGNHLDAYSVEPPFEHQRVISSAHDDPEHGLDINAQLCFFDEDGARYLIAGEDTDQDGDGTQGWGIFEITGDEIFKLAKRSGLSRGRAA